MASALSDYGPGGIAADYKQAVKGQRGKRELAENVEAGTAGMSEAEKRQRRGLGEAAAVRAGQAAVEDVVGLQSPGQQTKSMMAIAKGASGTAAEKSYEMDLVSAQLAENRRLESKQDTNESAERTRATVDRFFTGAAEMVGPGGTMTDRAGAIADYAPLLLALCWVAREVLPGQWRDCRTYILFRAPSRFRLWYAKNGEETAEWLHAHPWAKPLVRPLFRYFAWRGKRMAQKNPYFIEIQSRLA
jgi:hypothetical protein